MSLPPGRAVRSLIVLALAAGMLLLSPTNAWACSCAVSATDVTDQVARATTIVDGTLDWVASNGIDTTYSVEVARVFKGKAAEREKLVGPASSAACGLGSLATDERYLFFIHGEHPGKMTVGLCGGSVPYDAKVAEQVEAATGSPGGPAVEPPVIGPVDQTPIEGTAWYTVLGTALAVGLVLTGLLLYARRTRGRRPS